MQTFSLNLLPLEDRKRLGYERMSRFFRLTFSITAVLFLIGDVLLVPTYFFLYFEQKGIKELVTSIQQSTQTEQAASITKLIQETNAKLDRLKKEHPLTISPLTRYISDSANAAPSGLYINSFLYDKKDNTISLRGKSARRDNLLAFIARLRENEKFTAVESPVGNLLKEEQADFSITLILKDAIPPKQ